MIDQHWWLYCPAAGALFVAAYYVNQDPSQGSGTWAVIWILLGLWVARKAILVLLALLVFGGLAWLFFGAIAALPVSVAVIVGAIIIALSIRRDG